MLLTSRGKHRWNRFGKDTVAAYKEICGWLNCLFNLPALFSIYQLIQVNSHNGCAVMTAQ